MKKLNGIHKIAALNVRTDAKAGLVMNHSARVLKVRAGVKAGGLTLNHSARALKVRAGIKAGGLTLNHSARVLGC